MGPANLARWLLVVALVTTSRGAAWAQAPALSGGFETIELPPLSPPAVPASESGPTPADDAAAARTRGLESWSFTANANADWATLNKNSLLNPGNVLGLSESGAYLEVRAYASDRLEALDNLRWLVKIYSASSDDAPTAPDRRSRFDEAFVDWRRDQWFASIGKRRVNWGHATAFNPVNVVAPLRNPLDPSSQTEGRRLGWLSYGGLGTLDVLVTQAEAGGRAQWGLRWDGSAGTKSGALYYFDSRRRDDEPGFGRMLGASFSMEAMPGLTLYGEAAHFSTNDRRYYDADQPPEYKSSGYVQAVLGSQLDLGGRTRANLELFSNGRGYSSDERHRYFAALSSASGGASAAADFESLAMNRFYSLLSLRKEVQEKFAGTATLLAAADGSFAARAEITYTISDYYEVKGSYVRSGGGRDTEFGSSPYRDVFQLRLSASF